MSLDTLDLFFGDANPAQARVYARCACNSGTRLNGHLTGPTCDFARTLPARIPFAEPSPAAGENRVRGTAAVVEAIIPDPCFWTPELPFLYQAKLELTGDRAERIIGLRRLAVRNRHLHFDGKRFVLRAIRIQNIDSAAEFARETWTALIVDNPSDDLCNFASRRGVLLIADLTTRRDPQLRRLAQWPAVAIALMDGNTALSPEIRAVVPNLLLAQYIPNNQSVQLAPWAQLAFVEVAAPAAFAQKTAGCAVPTIAVRWSPYSASIERSRAACDALQSELTPHGDFAGYAV